MTIHFTTYTSEPGFTQDFLKVYEFLKRINQKEITTPNFLWARWEWMFSLPYLKIDYLNQIGIWKDDEKIVALVTYESTFDEAFLCIDPGYTYLKEDILTYVENTFLEGHYILIDDTDRELQKIALAHGYKPTKHKQPSAIIDIIDSISYKLPEGFKVVSLKDEFDVIKYGKVLWKGFNHEGEMPMTDEKILELETQLKGPHVNLNHKIAVVAPNGEFVSYCGMWYDIDTNYALVEPVATHPDYRMMGLGKAAVLEGVKRVGKDGAKVAFVGFSQEFYYSIGFYPVATETMWRKK